MPHSDQVTAPISDSGTHATHSPVPGDPGLPLELPAGARLGHYRIQERLGAGGFGSVWSALDLRLEREVALKLLTPRMAQHSASRAPLEAEVRAVAALAHPGIVTLHALEEADGLCFLVMERVRGRLLAELMREGPVPGKRVLNLGLQLCEALAEAHRVGIIHRDLNPNNIMVADQGRVKILDFGLALRRAAHFSPEGEPAAEDDPIANGLTGTLPYMSPEQLEGRVLDPRSDLFSLGVVLFELAAGRRPFQGASLAELTRAILVQDCPWPEHAEPGLGAILRRCLEKEPGRRFQTCQELHEALDALRRADGRGGLASPVIAILPFRDLSGAQDETPFCEGMAEEILTTLSGLPDLQVLSRAASFAARTAGLDPADLGRRLGASHLVSGSVRKDGERLRITTELLEAASGLQLWSGTYDRDRRDVFRIQEEIAAGLLRELRLTLVPLAGSRQPVELEAYEDYLRGRHWYFRYNRHGMRFALQMFQQALERNPDYANAWAGVANCAAFLYIYADRSEANRTQAEAASARALELDPNLAEAHASRGVALSALGQAEAAEASFETALRLDPNLYEAAYLYARHCFGAGRMEQAVALFERAAALFPSDCQASLLVAQAYIELGREGDARAARRRGLALAEEHLRQHPDDVRTRYLGGNALVALGERDKGLAWARMARALDPGDPMLLYNLGCIHALAENPEEALDCLEQAVAAGLNQKAWFLHDGDLAGVRELPRFRELIAGLD
jgi:serine/threonine protein kinase/Flp pilus assembly protein TadD